MKNTFHFSKENAVQSLAKSPHEFAQLFRRGTLEVEIYQPSGTDNQHPHTKDELYVIISGSGFFYHECNTFEVTTGDAIFVPALDEHRFFNFTEDFITWVFFFGSDGGETPD